MFQTIGKTAVLLVALVGAYMGNLSEPHAAKLVDENVCILENMGKTSSPLARRYISDACNFLSLQTASLMLNREQRDFHQCVLKYLPGTEADLNATDMSRACRQLVWDGKKIP